MQVPLFIILLTLTFAVLTTAAPAATNSDLTALSESSTALATHDTATADTKHAILRPFCQNKNLDAYLCKSTGQLGSSADRFFQQTIALTPLQIFRSTKDPTPLTAVLFSPSNLHTIMLMPKNLFQLRQLPSLLGEGSKEVLLVEKNYG
jgi:hypothetical protein